MKEDEQRREDEICRKIDANEKMCCTCRHYLDFRIPEQIEKYAPGEGRCMFPNKVTAGVMGFAKLEYLAGVYEEEFSAEWDIIEEIENAGGQIEQKELIKKYRSTKMFYRARDKALDMELIDEIRLETKGNPRLLMLKK